MLESGLVRLGSFSKYMTGVATMSNAVSFAKSDITDFFRRTNSRAGAILGPAFFNQRYKRYNPKQQEAFDVNRENVHR